MKFVTVFSMVVAIVLVGCNVATPPKNCFYIGAFPGTISLTGGEDEVGDADVKSLVEVIGGKHLAWVYASDSWYIDKSREFPLEFAKMCYQNGSVPYIRLMLWSEFKQNEPEPTFTLDRIKNGKFDSDLWKWAKSAAIFKLPLMVEYGVEVNGDWFPWNGSYFGGGTTDQYGDPNFPDGPELFRDAYRHIIQIFRNAKADNVSWVFHVNNSDWPQEDWNKFENYYPGKDWIDWIGVSVYGVQTPMSDNHSSFTELMDKVYPRLEKLADGKSIIVSEFACTSGNPGVDQARWAEDALKNLTAHRWPKVVGFSWWNDYWENDDNPGHRSDMRVQDNQELQIVFLQYVSQNKSVLGTMRLEK